MNCEDFNDRLPEYLDEALSAGEQAAAAEHIQKCADCRRELARQEAFTKSIQLSLNREVQGLSLLPETKRNILNALEPAGGLPRTWGHVRTFMEMIWRRPAWSGAILLCLLLLISGWRLYYRRPTNDRHIYIIDVPFHDETHVYRRQNDLVVDAVITGTSVADASLSESVGQATSSKSHIN